MAYRKFWLLFTLVLLLDLLSKDWAVENSVELRQNPVKVLDLIEGHRSFLEFTYVTNPGAAWSMFSDYPGVLTILAFVALASIYFFRKNLELARPPIQIIFGLICGGIVGNLFDRIFREPAEVVDFIDVFIPFVDYDYPIFNIADSGIFLGAFAYLFLSFFETQKEKAKNEENKSATS
ncbi:MAG: signal peptidase II [Opitutae bacterium]|nr:signal peptidase II [Opitutae bacterium]